MALFWLSLAFLLAVTIASSILVTLRGLAAFRAFKRLGRSVGEGLERIERATAQIERHLERATRSGSALEASSARLRASRERLAVLTAALADVRASLGRLTAVVPRSK
jgi:hypothetical protein